MTSYLSENETEKLQNGDIHLSLLKFLTLEWDVSRTFCRIEVNGGSFLAMFTLFIRV